MSDLKISQMMDYQRRLYEQHKGYLVAPYAAVCPR